MRGQGSSLGGPRWGPAVVTVTIAVTLTMLPAMAGTASASANAGWRSRACERDGSPLLASPFCTPNPPVHQPPSTPATCEGAIVCMGTYADLRRAGFDITGMRAADRRMLAAHPELSRPPSDLPQVATTTYSAWMDFYLYANLNCSGTVSQNGRCGWLYHKYIKIVNGVPKTGVTTSAYPARSGNNNPAQDWVVNVGPIPNEFTYAWGFMNGVFTGFESDTTDTFSPGKWRLDPWSVTNNGVTRGAFEVHGGINAHSFYTTGTQGCIRLPAASITSLKSMWNNFTSNKKDGVSVSINY